MNKNKTVSFDDRRGEIRHRARLDVNYQHGDTYLFSRSSNISEMGIFIIADAPLQLGTRIELCFKAPRGQYSIEVTGEVVWIDQNRATEVGMGLRFVDPSLEIKNQIKALIRTIAYLD